jgi:hypothetical protein
MPKVFISYSHRNEDWKKRLVKQLRVLAGCGLEVWNDRDIAAGDDWLPAIEGVLGQCDCALLLISADFLTSAFILRQEVPALLERRRQQGVRVIPVIVEPCPWDRIPWLEPIQARPTDGKPLALMEKPQAEAALAALAGEVHDLLGGTRPPTADTGQPPRADLTKLPQGAGRDFLGRKDEPAWLDAAWDDACSTHSGTDLVELTAPGGTGKTALVKRWLEDLKFHGWCGAQRVYAWSFYSQGTSDDRQASDDPFLAAALDWFRVDYDPALSPGDKGRLLAEALTAAPTLLVLDGIEPLAPSTAPCSGASPPRPPVPRPSARWTACAPPVTRNSCPAAC